MSISYKLLANASEIDVNQWNTLENESTFSNVFHSYDYFCFLQKVPGVHPFVFGISLQDELQGVIVGYILYTDIKFIKSITTRAIIHGAPLLAPAIAKEGIESLLLYLSEQLKQTVYIECRNYFDLQTLHAHFIHCGYVYKEHLNFNIDCTNKQTIVENLDVNRKREIKSMAKQGFVCTEAANQEEVSELYTILQALYKNKLNIPVFNKQFFSTLFEQPFSKIFVVKKNQEIYGGIVCVHDKNTLYEWFICGTKTPKVSPQVLATWHAIEYANAHNFKSFDFMGAGKPNEYYGVREFKSRFGGDLVHYGRYVKIQKKVFYLLISFILKTFMNKRI